MQIPKRRSDQFKKRDDGPVYLTKEGIEKKKKTLIWLNEQLPPAIKEVERTKEYGDFSENAEYKEAKHKLRQIHSRIFKTKTKLARAEVIDTSNNSDQVEIGSTIVVEVNSKKKTFQILGVDESNPSKGKISHLSPLGSALLRHKVGDDVEVELENDRKVSYKIVDIQ